MNEVSADVALIKTSSLASLLQREITDMILSGELHPGDRLNERALSAEFGVSRGPVREACRDIASRGLVELRPKQGVFVRDLSLEEALQCYDVRTFLFGAAAQLGTPKIEAEEIEKLDDLIRRMDEVAANGDVTGYLPLNLEFHETIVRAARNPVLMRLYKSLVDQLILCRMAGLAQVANLERSNREHKEIVDGLRARDPERAFAGARDHISGARRRMALAWSRATAK